MITRPVITGAATLVAASALAYGGWTLFVALTTPAPAPVVFAALTPPALTADTPASPLAPLAPIFGEANTMPPDAPEMPEPEPLLPEGQPWQDQMVFEDDYILRGVITGETGAMAILDTPDGTQVVREGAVLLGGEEVMTIGPDSIEILIGDEMFSIGFTDDMMDPTFEDMNALELLR